MMTSRQHMRGVGAFTVIVFVLFAVLVVNFGLTIGKDYMQYRTVRSIMTDIATTPGAAARTDRQIWNDLDSRFSINSIYGLVPREITSFEEDGGGRYMLADYEVRREFFGNLDLVAKFSHRTPLAP